MTHDEWTLKVKELCELEHWHLMQTYHTGDKMNDTTTLGLMRLVGEQMPIFRSNRTEGYKHIHMRAYKCKDITDDVLSDIQHNRYCHFMDYAPWQDDVMWKTLHNQGYTHIMIEGRHSTFSKFGPHRHYE